MEKKLSKGEKAARDALKKHYNLTSDKYDSILRKVDETWTRKSKKKWKKKWAKKWYKIAYPIDEASQHMEEPSSLKRLKLQVEDSLKEELKKRKIARILCRYLGLLLFGSGLISLLFIILLWSFMLRPLTFQDILVWVFIYHVSILFLLRFIADYACNKLFEVLSRKWKELLITLGYFVIIPGTLLWFHSPWSILIPIVIFSPLLIEVIIVLLIDSFRKSFNISARHPWDNTISRYMARKEEEELKASNSKNEEQMDETSLPEITADAFEPKLPVHEIKKRTFIRESLIFQLGIALCLFLEPYQWTEAFANSATIVAWITFVICFIVAVIIGIFRQIIISMLPYTEPLVDDTVDVASDDCQKSVNFLVGTWILVAGLSILCADLGTQLIQQTTSMHNYWSLFVLILFIRWFLSFIPAQIWATSRQLMMHP